MRKRASGMLRWSAGKSAGMITTLMASVAATLNTRLMRAGSCSVGASRARAPLNTRSSSGASASARAVGTKP